MLYSMSIHGANISKLVSAASQAPGETMLIVRDANNVAFGAFVSRSWPEARGDFGNGETFVFHFDDPEAVELARIRREQRVKAANSLTGDGVVEAASVDADTLLGKAGGVKGKLAVFGWSGQNFFYGHVGSAGITIGGGTGPAIFVDDHLRHGISQSCSTFNSPCLASEENYDIFNVELWGHSSLGLVTF